MKAKQEHLFSQLLLHEMILIVAAHEAEVFHTKYLPTLITPGLTEKIGFHTSVLVQVQNLANETVVYHQNAVQPLQLAQPALPTVTTVLIVDYPSGLYGLNSDYPLIKKNIFARKCTLSREFLVVG